MEPVKLNPSTRFLLALNNLDRHIYGGTVAPAEVLRRRKASKAARAARRLNRNN